jgi:hypothetical protein
MINLPVSRFFWWFWVHLIRACGSPFLLYPVRLTINESLKLHEAAIKNDIVIIFNAGGWGDASLSEASDFRPILEGMQQNLHRLGYSSVIIPYNRVPPGLSGKMVSTKEQINSFKHTSPVQVKDIQAVASKFPDKRFLIAGYSVGGGLSGKTLKSVADQPNVFGITVGTPGWYYTHSSARSLVLNNGNRDPVSVGDVNTMAKCVFKCPINWLQAKVQGRKLSLPLALQIPHHEYNWESPEVSPHIIKFLETHFKAREN